MTLCIKCGQLGDRKYNQLKEMCDKHYSEIVAVVHLICGQKKPAKVADSFLVI